MNLCRRNRWKKHLCDKILTEIIILISQRKKKRKKKKKSWQAYWWKYFDRVAGFGQQIPYNILQKSYFMKQNVLDKQQKYSPYYYFISKPCTHDVFETCRLINVGMFELNLGFTCIWPTLELSSW